MVNVKLSAMSTNPIVQQLKARAQLLQRIRQFFDQRGYLEVQTPIMSSESVVDAHLDPLEVMPATTGIARHQNTRWFLQTSPELLMKRLLSQGAPSIYQIGPVFRGGESGDRHNPEFTMLEWYGVGDSFSAGIQVTSDLAQAICGRGQPEVITYREAFLRWAAIDPWSAGVNDLQGIAESLQMVYPEHLDRDGWLELIFSEVIQPNLSGPRPWIVSHYPLSQAALSQPAAEDPCAAERYELFLDSIELGNGYGELRDAGILEARIVDQNRRRQERGASPLPAPEKLLSAMRSGLPLCSGCAIGIDRLLMTLKGVQSIEEVIAFPIDSV